MQQQQRFILFLILSMALFFAWFTWGPELFPNLFPKPPQKKQQADGKSTGKTGKSPKGKKKEKSNQAVAGKREPVEAPRPRPRKQQPKVAKKEKKKIPEKKAKKPPEFQPPGKAGEPVILGSLDPDTGFFIQAQIDPRGAAVDWVKLNDTRYRTVMDRNEQLKVVGNSGRKVRTFDVWIPLIDRQLRQWKLSLRTVPWKMEKRDRVDGVTTGITYSFTAPDGTVKVYKRYWLEQVAYEKGKLRQAQDTMPSGYELRMQLVFENLSDAKQTLTYELQGPVGLPLEDLENSRDFRSVVVGLFDGEGDVETETISAEDVVENGAKEEWTRPVKFIGVDVHYFAALVLPQGDQPDTPTISLAKPVVLEENGKHSDVSVVLTSKEVDLAPKSQKTHGYYLYTGPKRKALLEGYHADGIIKYGWSWIAPIARGMLWLLNLFHSWGIAYGFAVILLTCVVRGALFPLSRKQALSAAKMKELQPQIAELKKKYGNDREKMARAQMELFAKHGYNPLAGCLPIFLQLPIFIGLYQALSNAVELRLEGFPLTWIDNLAAPDRLFELPFRLPFLGEYFNLLPILTIFLFVAQQKMFMPPATDDQTAMQQKMMMYMSIFFGFLFYRVPSGLCIYFIASSLWGMAERKLLDKAKAGAAGTTPDETKKSGSADSSGEGEKPKGFFGRLLQMADNAAQAKARANGDAAGDKSRKGTSGGAGGKKKGKRKGRSRR